MDIYNFLDATARVYRDETRAIQQAKSNPQAINYLVGKIIQHTQGECKPELALKVCKVMVENYEK